MIGSDIQKLMEGDGDSQKHVSLLLFFQNKESGLMMLITFLTV
jgi:hypothetical protein